jgi:hypothetical protein
VCCSVAIPRVMHAWHRLDVTDGSRYRTSANILFFDSSLCIPSFSVPCAAYQRWTSQMGSPPVRPIVTPSRRHQRPSEILLTAPQLTHSLTHSPSANGMESATHVPSSSKTETHVVCSPQMRDQILLPSGCRDSTRRSMHQRATTRELFILGRCAPANRMSARSECSRAEFTLRPPDCFGLADISLGLSPGGAGRAGPGVLQADVETWWYLGVGSGA